MIPLLTRAVTVMMEWIFGESLSSRDQTSPNNTSSFSCANLGANSPRASRPAVCFTISFLLVNRKRHRYSRRNSCFTTLL